MSVQVWLRSNPHAASICRVVGLCLFVLAFFLPACGSPFVLRHRKSVVVLPGWECAEASLAATPELFGGAGAPDPFWQRSIAAMCGWVNPLILMILFLSYSRKIWKLRRALAAAAVLCILAVWVEFYVGGFTPLIGHFLWIAGALLVLAPDMLTFRLGTSADKIPAPSKA